MTSPSSLDELVILWDERRRRGECPSPEELCAACPELLEPLRRQLVAMAAMEALLQKSDTLGHQGVQEPSGPPGVADELVPGFEILGKLGQGGMGVVYKARQVRLDRIVALKMIRHGDEPTGDQLSRFQIEAEAVARLQHPNIVQIYQFGEHAGQPYFALEYVGGGSLAQRLTGSPWPPQEAARLVMIVANAVEHAHGHGIIHRDLTPGNILVAADGTPKVSDFGLARRLASAATATLDGAILGTPGYMAPEQAGGRADQIGPWTDVFGLGAILYALLTGRPPYRGQLVEVVEQLRAGRLVPPRQHNPRVPPALERICCKALSTDPVQRYATAAELGRDLQRYLDRPHRLRRWLAAGAAVVLAAVVIAALVFFLPQRDENTVPPPPLTGPKLLQDDRLVLLIWSKDGSKKGMRIGLDPGALPAQRDDQIRAEVRLNQPAYVYLLALDSQGDVLPLYPWHQNVTKLDATLRDPPPRVPPQQTLIWPSLESGQGLPMDDHSGLETILLLARRDLLPADDTLARLFGPLPLPPASAAHPEEFVLRGGDAGQTVDAIRVDLHRGFQRDLTAIDDPLDKLLTRLRDHFELRRAVRFAHQGH